LSHRRHELTIQNACVLVDLCLHWKYEYRPRLKVGAARGSGFTAHRRRSCCLSNS
jgi:hypothetical protein